MAERARDRVVRMLGLVSYLEAHGDTPFTDLAAQFDTTVDQIRSDMLTLWLSGLPGYMPDDLIDFDPFLFDEGIARLTAGQGVSQVRLSAREAVALLGALASFEASGAAPEAVSTAIAKIRDALGGSAVTTRTSAHLNPEIMETLREGITTRRTVVLDYVNASDVRTQREVEPHRLVAIADVAYLECFCRRAQGYRTLRVDRVVGAQPGENDVVTPASDEVGFTLSAAFEARVVMARSAQRALEDLPGVTLTQAGDDVVARFGVANIDVVVGRLLTVAPLLRLVEPSVLREALAARAESILDAQA